MFDWDWEDIIGALLWILITICLIWIVWILGVTFYDCAFKNDCPQPQEQKEKTHNSNGTGLKCGYVFGHGFVCGIW